MPNKLVLGVLSGIPFPFIAFMLTHHTDLASRWMPDKPGGLYVIALAVNLVSVWIAYRNGLDELGKGIVLSSFLGMLVAVLSRAIML